MQNIRAVIVDDEKNSLEALKTLLQEYCKSVEIIMDFYDPREALDYILKTDFDLLFLDINMPFMSGLDLLNKVPHPRFHTIFTTAFDQYAVEAIRLEAMDYLLKPVDPSDLIAAVERVKSKLNIDTLQEENPKRKVQNVLLINQLNNISIIHHEEILYLKADNNYTVIQTTKKSILASKTLKGYEPQLPTPPFYRAHQSYIVNLRYMEEFSKSDQCIILEDGTPIPLSKNRKEGLFKLLV